MLKTTSRFDGVRTLLVLTLAFTLALILLVVVARTVTAGRVIPTTPLTYRAPALDGAAAVEHLSTALRFETISYDDRTDAPTFERFRAWLAATYPRFHASVQRTVVADGTLVYEWTGRDPSLQPIVMMAHQDVVPVPRAGALDASSLLGNDRRRLHLGTRSARQQELARCNHGSGGVAGRRRPRARAQRHLRIRPR